MTFSVNIAFFQCCGAGAGAGAGGAEIFWGPEAGAEINFWLNISAVRLEDATVGWRKANFYLYEHIVLLL